MHSAFRLATSASACLLLALIGGRTSGLAEVAAPRTAARATIPTTAELDARFDATIKPFLKTYCFECHSGDKPEAELDLSTFTSRAAAVENPRWPVVLEMIETEEMPEADAERQPTAAERRQAVAWFQALRTHEITRNAGDPGLVLARRLSNAEYDYTIRDLTGVDLRPTREFPADPQNPAGFDNSGESLVMSPSLLKKYLAAAREVSNHLYLDADSLEFAPHAMLSDVDRDKLLVHRIVDFYHRHNTSYVDYFRAAWRYKHRAALGRPPATLAQIAAENKVSAKYLVTLWNVFEGPRETIGPLAGVQARWRVLPAPGNRRDPPEIGFEALRGYIELVRAKIEPRFMNLVAPGVNAAQQPFMIWKNVQYATHRLAFDPAQLQVVGEPRPAPFTGVEPGNNQFGPGATAWIVNHDGDPDLLVPVGKRAEYEAAFGRFARVFPDMFYMQERGRHYFVRNQDRGRLLDAGFHSLMGYFRDDQPLYELVLDEAQQAELDAMWLDMDVVGSTNARMYQQFIENQTSQGGGRGRVPMPPNPNGDAVTSEARIKAIEAAYLEAAAGGEPKTFEAIRLYFGFINDRVRLAERVRREAEPKHLAALLAFAGRAYRRPLTAEEQAGFRAHYTRARQDGLDHEGAMRELVVTVLMAPDFLYRLDRLETSKTTIQPLSDYALASRLSYFLWSSAPDAELLRHAAAGDLHRPAVITAQARRMLKDPRARALAVEFGGNWLDFRRLQELNTVDRERFPAFTSELRQAMFEEPVRLLLDVMQRDRPVLDLIFAKDTFVNPPLAKHYGMPAPPRDAWVRIPDATIYQRGGLLPMAAFLTRNAPGLRTSPVKRGNWVVKNVLGERISPPPATVPKLPADEAKADLPLRESLARHRTDPQCAACHAKFDAMGLVFEGYGPVGERRDTDLAGRPVDASATFPGGSSGSGVDGLRRYIRAHRQQDFVENLSAKLLAYALGRSYALTDQPLVDEMRRTLPARGYRFESLVEGIVTSRQFLNQRGSMTARPSRESAP